MVCSSVSRILRDRAVRFLRDFGIENRENGNSIFVAEHGEKENGKRNIRKLKRAVAGVAALIAGLANGFFGGGGGTLVVPTLRKLMDCEEKKSHATAIAVMLPVSMISGAAYLLRGVRDLWATLEVGSGVIVGGVIGAVMLRKVPKGFLTGLFYLVMIYAGIRFVRG